MKRLINSAVHKPINFYQMLCIVVLVFISAKSHALELNTSELDCLQINQNLAYLEISRQRGLMRYAIEPDIETTFSYATDVPFSDYLRFAKKLIEQRNPQATRSCPINTETRRIQLTHKGSEKQPLDNKEQSNIAALVAPFELLQPKNEKVILLIHGLTDSPFHFHDLATYFYRQGFSVRTLLIPGHGTAASDLNNITLKAWRKAVAYGIKRTQLDFKKIYLGGLSAGGALIIDYLINQKRIDKINGLFMWAPALKAKNELAWLASYLNYLPYLEWLEEGADSDFAKYESFPINAAAQMNSLMDSINKKLADGTAQFHHIPLLIVASEVDSTIDSNATLRFASKWHKAIKLPKPAQNTFIYYGDSKLAKAYLPGSIRLVTPKCENNVLCKNNNVAHTAMVNSPDNAQYGVQAIYRNCNHYLASVNQYKQCKEGEVANDEIMPDNLTGDYLFKRLTYNPHYFKMLDEMSIFLSAIN